MPDIIPVPAFKDNYIWMLHDRQHAVAVDPGDAAPVRAWLAAHRLQLSAILCTHHHHDHTGGICELAQVYNAPVYGPHNEDIPCVNHAVGEGDRIEIDALGIKLEALDIPGHTRGHVAYLLPTSDGDSGALFPGDTLFGCGCGRLFEGTAAQLHGSLQRLAQLPDETRVYCAHEYTEANIRFALACEPGNTRLARRRDEARTLREAGRPTLPSSIALEKATNPFLRCAEPEIIRSIEKQTGRGFPANDAEGLFAALREWRNGF